MPNGIEFPKFPTAITEADRERIQQLEEQRKALEVAYQTKFSKEAWAGVPAIEKVGRRVTPPWLLQPTIKAIPGTAETIEFGLTPEQFQQKRQEVEEEFRELSRRQKVTALLPDIQADLLMAAMKGEPITDTSDLISTFPELGIDFTDEEIGYLARMAQTLQTASPEQIMSGELFAYEPSQLPVGKEDYDALFKKGVHDPTQTFAAIEFAKDFEEVAGAIRSMYPSTVSDDEAEEAIRKSWADYFRGVEERTGIVPERKPKESIKEYHARVAADEGKVLTLVSGTGDLYTARVKEDKSVWIGDELIGGYDEDTKRVVYVDPSTGKLLKTEEDESNWFQEHVWQNIYSSIKTGWKGITDVTLGIVPRAFMPEYAENYEDRPPYQKSVPRELWEARKRGRAKVLSTLGQVQEERDLEHQEWLKEHPEFEPKPEYTQSPIEHTELLRDSAYYAYLIFNQLPLYTAAYVVGMGTALATKNPMAGAVAGAALITPLEISEIHADVLASGGDEQTAAQLATIIGSISGAVEILPNYIAIKILNPALAIALKKTLRRELVKVATDGLKTRGLLGTGKKVSTDVMKMAASEILFEEGTQTVLQNAAVKAVDETRSLTENLPETYIQSMIAFMPMFILGGGASYLNVRSQLPPKVQAELDKTVEEMTDAGLEPEHAEAVAVSVLLETETGQAQVEEAIAKVKEEAPVTPEKVAKAEEDIDSYTGEIDTLISSIKIQEDRMSKLVQPYEKASQQETIDNLKDELAEVMKEKELAQTSLKKTRKKAEKVVTTPKVVGEEVTPEERRKRLGVTEEGYRRGIIEGEFLANHEAFLAKLAEIEVGQYKGIDITKRWFGEGAGEAKHEQVKPFLSGLSETKSEFFNYTDTHGLDLLTVKEVTPEVAKVPSPIAPKAIVPIPSVVKEFNLEGKDIVTTYAKDGIIKSINGVTVSPEQYEAHGEDLMDYLELNFTVESTTKNEQLGGWKTVFKRKVVEPVQEAVEPEVVPIEATPEMKRKRQKIMATSQIREMEEEARRDIFEKATGKRKLTEMTNAELDIVLKTIQGVPIEAVTPEATLPLIPAEWIPEFTPTEPGRTPDMRPRLIDYEEEELLVKKALAANLVIANKIGVSDNIKNIREEAKTKLNNLQVEYNLAKEVAKEETIKATESKLKAMAKEAGLPRKALLGKGWDDLTPDQQVDLTVSMIEEGSLTLPAIIEGANMKHYVRYLEERTGLPFYQLYPRVRKDFGASQRAGEKVLEGLKTNHRLREIRKSKAAQVRVTQAINSKNDRISVPPVEDLTSDEELLMNTVEGILEHYAPYVRYLRVMATDSNLEAFKEEFPDAVEKNKEYELQIAIKLKENGAYDNLWMHINNVTWGTITGYTPWIKAKASIFPRQIKLGTTRGESRLMQRDSIEFDSTIGETLLLDVVRYVKQIEAQWRLRPDLETYDKIWKKTAKKFKNNKRIESRLKKWGSEMQSMPPEEGSIGIDLINRVWRQAMSAVFLHPRLSGRNVHQGMGLHPDRTELLRLFKQAYPEAIKEKARIYYDNFVHQLGGIRTDFLLSEGQGLPGLGWFNKWADSWSLYAKSDNIPRLWSFLGSANKAWRATEAYLASNKTTKDVNKWVRKSGALHLTKTEQNYALQLLARAEKNSNLAVPGLEVISGAEEVSFYIGHEMADITHLIYTRAFRAPIEMGTTGRLIFNLMVFPRGYAERVVLQSQKVGGIFHKDTNWAEAASGFKDILLLTIIGSFMSSWISFLFGWKRRAYDPLNIIQWQLGGLALGVAMDLAELATSVVAAFDFTSPEEDRKAAKDRIPNLLERNTLTMIPFYKNLLDSIESASGTEDIGVHTLYRELRGWIDSKYTPPEIEEAERALWEKFRHAIFASEPLDPTDIENIESQLENSEIRLGERDVAGRSYTIGNFGNQVDASTKNLPDYVLNEDSGFSSRAMFRFHCVDKWEDMFKLPSDERNAWREEHILEEAMLIFWEKRASSVFVYGSPEEKEVTRLLSIWINEYEIDYFMHKNPKVQALIGMLRGIPERFPTIPFPE